MKKIIYIALALFSTTFNSCEVEGEEKPYFENYVGNKGYTYTYYQLNQYVDIMDFVVKVDFYAQAKESDKAGILNYYFQGYKITNTPTTWIVKNSNMEWLITHNQKSINEQGAAWSVKLTNLLDKNESLISEGAFIIESLGDKNWTVKITNLTDGANYILQNRYIPTNPNLKGSATLIVEANNAFDKTPNLYDYKVSCTDGYIKSNFNIKYKTEVPLNFTYMPNSSRNLQLTEGKISFEVEGYAEKGKAVANIAYNNTQLETTITSNGVTENWFDPYSYGYGYY